MSASRNVNIILNKLSVMIISNKAKGGGVMSIGSLPTLARHVLLNW